MKPDLLKITIPKIKEGLREKQFSSVELTKAFLERIGKLDKKVSAFISLNESSALEQAQKIDQLISQGGDLPVFAGVPIAVKDNILVEGQRNTCASKILENYTAAYDATCISKLKKAGAIILGKTNLDEFAMGASTENSAFFPTKNPADEQRVPGGSSGGSAAAVAADLCAFALGSDTGGSIRQPSSFCGVVGLKPTYGAVSRYGLVAFASSLDQIGPITKTAEDCAAVFRVISGRDPKDATTIDAHFQFPIPNFQLKNLRLGVPKEYFVAGIDKEVEKTIKSAIQKLKDLGAEIIEISLPYTKYVVPAYYLTCTSEASANLARYDGIKYGFSALNFPSGEQSLLDVYLKSREQGFGAEVKRRIVLGTYALSSGYYQAYYLKAQKMRTLIIKDFQKAFEQVDAILSPVSPTPAFKLGEKTSDPLSMYLCDIYTAQANIAGLPAVSSPAGLAGKLPIGLQIIGRPFEENKILEIAKLLEL